MVLRPLVVRICRHWLRMRQRRVSVVLLADFWYASCRLPFFVRDCCASAAPAAEKFQNAPVPARGVVLLMSIRPSSPRLILQPLQKRIPRDSDAPSYPDRGEVLPMGRGISMLLANPQDTHDMRINPQDQRQIRPVRNTFRLRGVHASSPLKKTPLWGDPRPCWKRLYRLI